MRTINVSFSLMLRDDPVATAELNEFVLSRVCEQITPHRTSPNLVSDLPTSLHVSSNCYYCSRCAELLLVYQPCSFFAGFCCASRAPAPLLLPGYGGLLLGAENENW